MSVTNKLRPFIIIFLGTLFYVYGFTLRIMPSAMTHELMQSFNMQAQTLGVMVGLMYWGYTLMQIPCGLLYDRFSVRIILTITIFICSFGTFLMGATNIVTISCIGSFVMGLGEAFGFVGVLVLASRWFAPKYFALITGLAQMMGSVGAILGEGPIALMVTRYGWRSTVLSLACFGVALGILFWFVIRDNPKASAQKHMASGSELSRLLTVTKSSQNWLVALYAFCIWAPVLITAGLWLVPFLMELYQVSNIVAASAVSWVWIGIGLGSPFFGWWSDRIGRRCMPLTVSALFSLVPAFFIIYGTLSWPMMNIMLFLFGIGASGQALSFGLVQDNNPPHVAGTAVGFNNMAVVFGGVLLQPLVGFILHSQWSGTFAHGSPLYTVSDYRHALITAPGCALIALVVSAFFLKETRCIPHYNEDESQLNLQQDFEGNAT